MLLSSTSPLLGASRRPCTSGLRHVIFVVRREASAARTINLAEPKASSGRRQVQKLVSADVTASSCPQRDSYRASRAVPVRICSRADLERACPTKFCACPQKPPPKTVKNILCEMAVFGAKSAVAGGLVYWTVAEGFWGEPKDTEEFYTRIRETMASDPHFDEVSLPRLEYIKFKILDSYNRAVLTVMGLLVGVSRKISEKVRDTLYPCESVEDEGPEKKKK